MRSPHIGLMQSCLPLTRVLTLARSLAQPGCLALILVSVVESNAVAAEPVRPNILLIVADDLRLVGCRLA